MAPSRSPQLPSYNVVVVGFIISSPHGATTLDTGRRDGDPWLANVPYRRSRGLLLAVIPSICLSSRS